VEARLPVGLRGGAPSKPTGTSIASGRSPTCRGAAKRDGPRAESRRPMGGRRPVSPRPSPRSSMSIESWTALAAIGWMTGCADVWGFQDLTSRMTSEPLDATSDDGAGLADSVVESGADGRDAGAGSESSKGDGGVEGGPNGSDRADASAAGGDASSAAGCSHSNCVGCCDTKGECQGGRSIAACGGAGLACVDCSTTACAILNGPCCAAANGCGCQLLSLGLTQCQ
jgi:hypothetical protein